MAFLTERTIELGYDDRITIVPIGDIHYGAYGCQKKMLQDDIKRILNDDHTYWVGIGDYIDAITTADLKRFDIRALDKELWGCLDNIAIEQIRRVAEWLEPIKDKCLGLVGGNHEETIRKQGHDLVSILAEKLDAPYLGDEGYIRLRLAYPSRSQVVLIRAIHGDFSGRTSGGLALWAERQAFYFPTMNITLAGHAHRRLALERIWLDVPPRGKLGLVDRRQVVVLTGGYLAGRKEGGRSYVERRGYPPAKLGTYCAVLKWTNTRRHNHWYLNVWTEEFSFQEEVINNGNNSNQKTQEKKEK